ncbi:MAG: methyltransferase domain-containing protein [Polyangiaceae bacterium]
MRQRVELRELMDDPVDSLTELEANLRDIARANRFLGGVAPISRELERTGATTVLDVGCGAADIPRVLLQQASRRNRALTITCLDKNEEMLRIAGGDVATSQLTFVRGDGTSLPYADGAFDVAMCSLTMHHLKPEDAVALLRELRRVSRTTPVVCDLRRSALAYAAVSIYVRLFSRNRLTRHDGPISVLRAYTPDEALTVAKKAGWHAPRVRMEPWFRMTLIDEGA